jgi:puromycin-sensitive aminopeptidase
MGAQRGAAERLDPEVRPERVELRLEVDPAHGDAYRGEVAVRLRAARAKRALRLHAVDLRVRRARLEVGAAIRAGSVVPRPGSGMVELCFPGGVPAGASTLRLAFAGRLRRDLCGLYRASSGRRRYAFTQLEATDARKFFPCFDEPAMKARFRLEVTTASGNAVLSNAPAVAVRAAGPGRKTVVFAETPPLSTYLLALAVGPLEGSRRVFVGPTPIRVWNVPGKGRLAGFALEAARECLVRLERWFGLPYPYPKLDLVAVPDFEFGAMENAGAVFFRETLLLLDPKRAALAEQKRAAEVIAHELAHMWYGDLVTMAWWDDLWLNEAFATWMAFQVVDRWRPEWCMWHEFQHGRAAALDLDALRHTHPIWCEVRTPAEAGQNFDLITYEKGAAVVRMLERYLGPNAFRRGVRRYVRRHREGNAVAADLWRALREASGQAVEPLARAWIERPGHPVLSIRMARPGGRGELRLRQERFFEGAQRAATRSSAPARAASAQRAVGERSQESWPIPWVARVGGSGRGRLLRALVAKRSQRIALGRGPAPRFVYGNAEEAGFFRPEHGRHELGALLASLRHLPALERMGLVDHQWALVRAGRTGAGSLLDLAQALASERDPDVLQALERPLSFLADSLLPDAAPRAAPALRALLVDCFGPELEAAGFDAGRGEGQEGRRRRAALLELVGGIAGQERAIAEAARRCERYLAAPRAIDPNLADAVVALAARVGDADLHRRFARAMRDAGTPQEARRFLLGLGAFREPRLVERTLALSLTGAVATQDVVPLLARLFANPAAREATWDFVRSRWPRLRRRIPPLSAGRLVEVTWRLLDPGHRRSVARFFAAHPVPSGERALRQALERFDWYRSFRRPAAADLARRLAEEPRS